MDYRTRTKVKIIKATGAAKRNPLLRQDLGIDRICHQGHQRKGTSKDVTIIVRKTAALQPHQSGQEKMIAEQLSCTNYRKHSRRTLRCYVVLSFLIQTRNRSVESVSSCERSLSKHRLAFLQSSD